MYSRIRIPSLGLELAFLLGSLIGCGGGTTPVQQFSMSISPSPVNVAAEATEQFSVKLDERDGNDGRRPDLRHERSELTAANDG